MDRLRILVLLITLAGVAALAEESNTAIVVDGVTYENVRWGAVSPSTVTIFHSTGVAKIPLSRLSPELQKRFGYDSVKAGAYAQVEAKNAQELGAAEVYRKDARGKLLISGQLTETNQIPFRHIVGFLREKTSEGLVIELAEAQGVAFSAIPCP